MSAGAGHLLGRYALFDAIASGGMATIYLGRQVGAVGFSRVVAVKRLHPHHAREADFVAMFLDEARLAARVRHPNVVETLDVVHEGAETFIVMEYVDGEPLSALFAAARERGQRIPIEIGAAIVCGLCHGLHAAHEARGGDGTPLGIVHRDVSPQNVLVGSDGVPRVVDFGVALANVRLQTTRAGQVKGKPAYMAPEQLARDEVTRATDLYAAGVILWEACAGRRAYDVASEGALYARVIAGAIPRLEEVAPWVPPALAAVVHRSIAKEPAARFATAQEMALAIEGAVRVAGAAALSGFLEDLAGPDLAARREAVRTIESATHAAAARTAPPAPPPPPDSIPAAPTSQPARPSARQTPSPGRVTPRPPLSDRGTHTVTSPGGIPGPPAVQRRWLALGGIIATAVLLAGALGAAATYLVVRAELRAASSGPAPSSPDATTAAGTAGPAIAGSGSPAPPSDATTEAPPSSSPPATSEAPPAEPPPPHRARALTDARSSGATPTPKAPCDPPYYVDGDGIRRVKRDCLAPK